jgi:hypothetical protein
VGPPQMLKKRMVMKVLTTLVTTITIVLRIYK